MKKPRCKKTKITFYKENFLLVDIEEKANKRICDAVSVLKKKYGFDIERMNLKRKWEESKIVIRCQESEK